MIIEIGAAVSAATGLYLSTRAPARVRLSRAKHPSLQGHPRMARRLARHIPYYQHSGTAFYACDGAPEAIALQRRQGFEALVADLAQRHPRGIETTRALEARVADAAFVQAHRVPFPFRESIRHQLPLTNIIEAVEGNRVRDADGNWAWDLTGSYGLNVLGNETYRVCLDRGCERARPMGAFLGGYHPLVADNAERLQRLSGLATVSFHMSGTEAIMQAVRVSRYHSGRRYIVRFAGAYHGWWDGVQSGVGSQRRPDDVMTLRDVDERSLNVLRTRRDIAAVLVSPLQAMHPNRAAAGDGTLAGARPAPAGDSARYARWLQQLREVCSQRGIALVFDEVFAGFRLAPGGAQAYFGVQADLVTYGKSLGGGLPVGVLCGRADLMRRYKDDQPANVCFARGTFNAHPYVMACMNEFLQRLEAPSTDALYSELDAVWARRTQRLQERLNAEALPLEVTHIGSVLSLGYTAPSRYNWLLQFYLRASGLALNWTGTGRLIFSHDYTDDDFDAVTECLVAGGRAMRADGWWWHPDGQTNRRLGRQILIEMARAKCRSWRRRGDGPAQQPVADG